MLTPQPAPDRHQSRRRAAGAQVQPRPGPRRGRGQDRPRRRRAPADNPGAGAGQTLDNKEGSICAERRSTNYCAIWDEINRSVRGDMFPQLPNAGSRSRVSNPRFDRRDRGFKTRHRSVPRSREHPDLPRSERNADTEYARVEDAADFRHGVAHELVPGADVVSGQPARCRGSPRMGGAPGGRHPSRRAGRGADTHVRKAIGRRGPSCRRHGRPRTLRGDQRTIGPATPPAKTPNRRNLTLCPTDRRCPDLPLARSKPPAW